MITFILMFHVFRKKEHSRMQSRKIDPKKDLLRLIRRLKKLAAASPIPIFAARPHLTLSY